jgi:hypothetical protein
MGSRRHRSFYNTSVDNRAPLSALHEIVSFPADQTSIFHPDTLLPLIVSRSRSCRFGTRGSF